VKVTLEEHGKSWDEASIKLQEMTDRRREISQQATSPRAFWVQLIKQKLANYKSRFTVEPHALMDKAECEGAY
jgi:hypothetical protein